ncbi:3'-phosphoadenosine 5'-phosphate phosphatase [Frankia canadensis]|uniref:3'-phosphoadenosine 5'-phosphate phosphatase n=1 Tax=Frankia canadensis TaxID=1836972 RepID=A0A2I2L025_9ACTN|nr:3'(2'),5'-bisphosphate nucleotidase CysQ [Frankia canadensis]SNQ51266.1 3'-phosphoadenosine 5'-phosphate phosphatase [Frankia canadensis]SOU58556.1 3'-phosphoadenosine 5'-phosphate phosphatase [Frankia canadensis]
MNTDDTSPPALVPVDIASDEIDDDVLARRLATDAGKLLLKIREEVGFAEPATLRDAGDARSQQLLARALARHRPDDAVLSEEAADDPARLLAERVWIVDPLDGTREFAEPGRSDWAVHVALWQAGELIAGAVALPALGVTLSAAGGLPSRPAAAGPPRIVASRTRAPRLVGEVAEALGATTVPMGSAGAKAAAVIRGQAEIYLHAGGQYEWDSAAPVAVARAAGLHTSRLDGSPLRYNQPDPLLPDLVICDAALAPAVLAAIAAAGPQDR